MSVFDRLRSGTLLQLTPKDNLSPYLVALLDAITHSPRDDGGAATIPAATAALAAPSPVPSTSSCSSSTSLTSFKIDPHAAAHIFQLVGRYAQVNHVNTYLQLNVSSIWEQVKRQSRYALTTLSDAEKSEQDAITFERGDQETRIRIVMTEIRTIARNIRRRAKDESYQQQSSTSTSSTPLMPPILSRVTSMSAPQGSSGSVINHSSSHNPAASKSPFISSLLTNSLFAQEISLILPVLYLHCRNAPGSTHSLTDEEDEENDDDMDVDLSRFEPTIAISTSAASLSVTSSPQRTSSSDVTQPSLFIPLRDLIQVLIHQGPHHGSRLLTLLATSNPFDVSTLLDWSLSIIQQMLTHLRDKMHSSTLALQPILHHPAQLAHAAHQIWLTGYHAIHSSTFATIYTFVNSVAQLSPTSLGLFVRLRISKLMEELKLTPPVLHVPPFNSAIALPAPSTVATLSPQLSLNSVSVSAVNLPASSVSNIASHIASTTLPLSSSSVPTTPSRSRSTVPMSLTASSARNLAATSFGNSFTTSSYLTPQFLSMMLTNSWSPLQHFLPSLALSVTFSSIHDELPFLIGVFNRINSVTRVVMGSEEKSASHLLVEYIRDSKMSDEYTDVVQTAIHVANTSAAAAATSALHAQASKARSSTPSLEQSSTNESGKKRKANDAAAASRGSQALNASKTSVTSSASSTSSALQFKAPRVATPNTSPSLSANKLSNTLASGMPGITIGSPQRLPSSSPSTFPSPPLHSMQMRELLLTPSRRGVSGGSNSSSTSSSRPSSPFYHGSIECLRIKLAAQLQRLTDLFQAQSVASISTFSLSSSLLFDLNRLIRIYSYLILYSNFCIRSHEVELITAILPTTAPIITNESTINPNFLVLLTQLCEYLLVLVAIAPQLQSSSSTNHSSRTSVTQWLSLLERLKSWMKLTQMLQRRDSVAYENALNIAPPFSTASTSPETFAPVDHLLLQLTIWCHTQRAIKFVHTVRQLLRLPKHFKPPALQPYQDRLSIHMKDLSHTLANTNLLWMTKYEFLKEIFQIQLDGDARMLHQHEVTGMYLFPSSYLSSCFSLLLTNASTLLRFLPNSNMSTSVPRTFFEYHVGLWWQIILQVQGRKEDKKKSNGNDAMESSFSFASTISLPPTSHPLLSHPSILTLIDSLIQLDLSSAISEQEHLQSEHVAQHKPAQCKHDMRLLKETDMKELLRKLTTPHKATSSLSRILTMHDLPNPFSLILLVYYFLYYNAVVNHVWMKCIPPTPTPTPTATPSTSNGVMPKSSKDNIDINVTRIPVPPPTPTTNFPAIYKQLGLPTPPFNSRMAKAVSNASALHPYSHQLLDEVPLRGMMEWMKTILLQKLSDESSTSSSTPSSSSSSTSSPRTTLLHIFLYMFKFLWKQYPETLIGFNLTDIDTTKVSSFNFHPIEGSLMLLMSEQSTALHANQRDTQIRQFPHDINSFLSIYSSSGSSSQVIYQLLLSILPVRVRNVLTYQEMLLDPFRVVSLLPRSIYSSDPSRLRTFLACIFHLLVASTSFFTSFSRAEYVSSQIVRQATYYSIWSAWQGQVKMMMVYNEKHPYQAPSQTHSDPMTFEHTREIDRAMKEVVHGEKSMKHSATAGTASTATSATAQLPLPSPEVSHAQEAASGPTTAVSTDLDGKIVKKLKIETIVESKAEGGSVPSAQAVEIKEAKEVIESQPNASNEAPRPFSFLVSDRLLTSGEQEIFSSDYVLDDPAGQSACATTPHLRSFLYLLTSRASIVHHLLDRCDEMIIKAAAAVIADEKSINAMDGNVVTDLRLSIDAIFSFLHLIFQSSTPPSSHAPSSLFLLVHFQSYSCHLIPYFFHHFPLLIRQLLKEPIIQSRLEAGWKIEVDNSINEKRHQLFFALLLACTDVTSVNSHKTDLSTTDQAEIDRILGVWSACASILHSSSLSIGSTIAYCMNRVRQVHKMK